MELLLLSLLLARLLSQLRPDQMPIVRVDIDAQNPAVGGEFQPGAVLGIWAPTLVLMAPLPDLRVALDRVSQRTHRQTEFRYTQRAWRGEVLVDVHRNQF